MFYKFLGSLRIFSLCGLLSLTSLGTAQVETRTSVPPGIRALLEQQSGNNPYRQMAQMQVTTRYGELLQLYDAGRRAAIEAVMIRVFGRRMQLSAAMTTVDADQSELARVSTADYLREQLAAVLTRRELRLYDDFRQGTSERQLRNTYGEQLTRAAPDMTAANREIVLDTMVRHMLLERSDITDPQAMITMQLQSLMEARSELEERLEAGRFRAAEAFLDQVQSNLYRNRGMYEAMQGQ